MNQLSRVITPLALILTEFAVTSVEYSKEFGFSLIESEMPKDPIKLINYLKGQLPLRIHKDGKTESTFFYLTVGLISGGIILLAGVTLFHLQSLGLDQDQIFTFQRVMFFILTTFISLVRIGVRLLSGKIANGLVLVCIILIENSIYNHEFYADAVLSFLIKNILHGMTMIVISNKNI